MDNLGNLNGKYRTANDNFFSQWNEHSAYILGYLEADGTFVKNSRLSLTVRFCASYNDLEYIQLLRKIVGSNNKLSINKIVIGDKEYRNALFCITSRQWKTDLEGKYRVGQIPDCITKELLPHYIRGYFDGDGSIYFSKQAKHLRSNFVAGSKELIEDLANKLRPIVNSKLTVYKKTSSDHCWYITLGNQATNKLVNYMYRNHSIRMKRKYKKASSLLTH